MYSREVLDMIEILKCTKERKKVNHVDCEERDRKYMGLHTHFLCILECSINGKGEEVEGRRTNEKNQKISFPDFSIPMYGCRSRLASCYGKH